MSICEKPVIKAVCDALMRVDAGRLLVVGCVDVLQRPRPQTEPEPSLCCAGPLCFDVTLKVCV